MIDRIEMDVFNYKVLIENDKCVINEMVCILENDDIDNIIRIIRNWKYEYRNNTIIGENHYFINIMSEGKEYVYNFDNEFPDDFKTLVDYIGGIYAR